jgi:CTP:phosphocholine cytidylyltransferase-like protein
MSDRLYVIEIDHPLKGPMLVGPWYMDKSACKSWVPFVKAAYHGVKTRTRSFSRKQAEEIQANGGQLLQ